MYQTVHYNTLTSLSNIPFSTFSFSRLVSNSRPIGVFLYAISNIVYVYKTKLWSLLPTSRAFLSETGKTLFPLIPNRSFAQTTKTFFFHYQIKGRQHSKWSGFDCLVDSHRAQFKSFIALKNFWQCTRV